MNKEVTLKELRLTNFKGMRNLTVHFGKVTEIRGANATGKSTIADAFTWALFGKDAQGNSDTKFGIKTVGADGKTIEKIDHEVTAILDINGEQVELRRCYKENWVTPRGKDEQEMRGHNTEYFYNGVPLKESEYKAKIDAIIDEDLFRMITSPQYFPRLEWQTQREMLLRIAGGVTLDEIADNRKYFKSLLIQLSGKSLTEFKAENASRKKKIKDELDTIPARIEENQRATPEAPDYDTLEKQKETLTAELDEVDKMLQSQAAANSEKYRSQQETQKEINALKAQQGQVAFKAEQATQKAIFEKNATYNKAKDEYDAKRREYDRYLTTSSNEVKSLEDDIRVNEATIQEYSGKADAKRKEWYKENAREFSDSDNCPTCGQLLPEETRANKRLLFDHEKKENLKRLTTEGQGLASKQKIAEQQNEALKKQLEELNKTIKTRIGTYKAELNELQKVMDENPLITESIGVNAEDMPEWKALQEQIEEKQKTFPQQQEDDNTSNKSELTAKKKELSAKLDEVKDKLALRETIEANLERRAELEKREKELAKQKAELEQQEFVADNLVKEQMNEVERRVNQQFTAVRIKMFTQQINGGEKPDCVLLSEATGAKYMDTNDADKIHIGLDIIATLCRFYEVTAPIFCDNAESVNHFPAMDSQMILLRVTEDRKLTIS